ncbi:MAG: CcoQ/FixQ family Cbb3-type cytochrome c oxidase assembly chaperone [Planctomycetes bacterium]|nr:CcoQ/FixQ family Cbb3-type cytochrome c oxidase assembly chaperone [Planctomycetota bacterium]
MIDIFDVATSKQIVLVFFFAFFVGVALWAFRSRRAKNFSYDANLPLQDGDRVNAETAQGSTNV